MRIDIIVIYITSVVICISGASAWTPSAGAPPPPRRDAWARETRVCRETAAAAYLGISEHIGWGGGGGVPICVLCLYCESYLPYLCHICVTRDMMRIWCKYGVNMV